jgi:hypothetical protein
METRIKYIKKNTAGEGYYAVQIKKWLFWKTIYANTIFANVENFIDTLSKIDEINNKTKSLNKIVYNGWAVRNVYKNTGSSYSINFFNSSVHKHKHNDNAPETTWADCNDSTIPTMEIKAKKLFGKECLEPMKVRITIEKMEE